MRPRQNPVLHSNCRCGRRGASFRDVAHFAGNLVVSSQARCIRDLPAYSAMVQMKTKTEDAAEGAFDFAAARRRDFGGKPGSPKASLARWGNRPVPGGPVTVDRTRRYAGNWIWACLGNCRCPGSHPSCRAPTRGWGQLGVGTRFVGPPVGHTPLEIDPSCGSLSGPGHWIALDRFEIHPFCRSKIRGWSQLGVGTCIRPGGRAGLDFGLARVFLMRQMRIGRTESTEFKLWG